MKALPALSFIAALVAFVFLPLNFVAAGSLLFAAGLGAILVADYGHRYRPLEVRLARVVAMTPQHPERFGLAA